MNQSRSSSSSTLRRARPPRPLPPLPLVDSGSGSDSGPGSARRRRNLRPRNPSRPLFEDFYGLSESSEEEEERSKKLKVKVGVKVEKRKRSRKGEDEGGSEEEEEEVKPLKKRKIGSSGGGKLGFERSGNLHEVRKNNVGPRSKGSISGLSPKLVRTTPLPDRNLLEEILEKLQKKDTYNVFAEAVDPEELPDYHDVIEHPMDFGTMRRKLGRNVYRSLEQFEDDVFLICSNAMQYNAPDTVYFRQAHSIQELARIKFQRLREEGFREKSELPLNPNPKSKLVKTLNLKPVKREEESRREIYNPPPLFKNNIKNEIVKKKRDKKPVNKVNPNSQWQNHNKTLKSKIPFNLCENKQISSNNKNKNQNNSKSPINFCENKQSSNNNIKKKHKKKMSFIRVCQEPLSSDISEAGTVGTRLSASRDFYADYNHERENDNINNDFNKYDERENDNINNEYDKYNELENDNNINHDYNNYDEYEDDDINRDYDKYDDYDKNNDESNMKSMDSIYDDADSLYNNRDNYEKFDDLSARESPSNLINNNDTNKNTEEKKPVDINRRKTYMNDNDNINNEEEEYINESDLIFSYFSPDPKELLSMGPPECEYTYARSLARFSAFVGPVAWNIISKKIEMALPAGAKFGRGWILEPESLSPPFLSLKPSKLNSSSVLPVPNSNCSVNSTSQSQGLTFGVDQNQGRVNSKTKKKKNHSKEISNNNNNSSSNNNNVNVFLKPPEVTIPRDPSNPDNSNPFMVSNKQRKNHRSSANTQGQNRNSMGFITKQPSNTNTNPQINHSNNNNNGPRSNGLPGQTNQPVRPVTGQKGPFVPIQKVKKEIAESPKNSNQQQSWISFGNSNYETKPSITVPPVPVQIPSFLGSQARPTSCNNSQNAPVWRPVNPTTSSSNSSSNNNNTIQKQGQNGNFKNQFAQNGQGQNNAFTNNQFTQNGQGQNGNFMNNQFVQTGSGQNGNYGNIQFPAQMARFQGFVPVSQASWQVRGNSNLVRESNQVRETNGQMLRPDLNIGFINSPTNSSPRGQISNLEAQQPDLALQL